MGIIRAIKQTVGGTLADQWLEVIEPENMGGQTVLTAGVRTGKGANRKGGKDTISNGSVIHVYEGQFMMLLDGGRIVDYSAEPGYFTVDNSSMPSMFSGSLDDVVKNSFDRFRFGGATPTSQKVLYLNLQEIKGIRFGTRNPISYFDNFYNAELFLRAHGTYSIRITDPIKFYVEAIPKNKDQVEITDINEQYLYEFLDALQSSINQMSADGMRISYVPSKSRELSKYMADTLDEDWRQTRGMEIQAVAIASLSYDEKSQELLNLRNQGAMLQDPSIREGYMQGAFARGMEAAGSNANGSTMGFMGMQMGAQMGGNMAASMSAANQQQMIRNQQIQQEAAAAAHHAANEPDNWICSCGQQNTGKFCSECGRPRQMGPWTCSCGQAGNAGKFCAACGSPRPAPAEGWKCPACGAVASGKFCPECGKPKPADMAGWTCGCGTVNKGKFCAECGKPKPAGVPQYKCDKCGWEPADPTKPPKFCPECGDPFDDGDIQG